MIETIISLITGIAIGLYVSSYVSWWIDKDQKEWLKRLNDKGYKAIVCYSLTEFIHEFNNYLKLV